MRIVIDKHVALSQSILMVNDFEVVEPARKGAHDMAIHGPALLAIAWPGGVPAAEAAFLASLPAPAAEKVLRRLSALLRVETGEVRVGIAASEAGVARSAFRDLRRAWEDGRTLRVLAPYATRPGRRMAATAPQQRAARVVRKALREHPELGNGDVFHNVATALRDEVATTTLRKLILHERAAMALEPSSLASSYGRQLTIDTCAVAIPVVCDGVDFALVAAFVVDRGSGLIFGHASGRADEGLALQRVAGLNAVAFVTSHGIDTDGPTRFRFVPGFADDTAIAAIADRFGRLPYDVDVVGGGVRRFGDRRFGERLRSSLGARVGRIRLLPASTPPGRPLPASLAGRRGLSLEDGRALLAGAVADHNALVLARLRAAGIVDRPVVGGGKLTAALLLMFGDGWM